MPQSMRGSQKDFMHKFFTQAQIHKAKGNLFRYVYYGEWLNNDVCSDVFRILTYCYDITIVVRGETEVLIGEGKVQVIVYYKNNHYSSHLAGGDKGKFKPLWDFIVEFCKITKDDTVCEVSAAPGYLINMIALEGYKCQALAYSRGLKWDKNNSAVVPKLYNNMQQFRFYYHTADVVICDAACAENSEAIIDEFVATIADTIQIGQNFIVKTFANPWSVWKFAGKFDRVVTYDGVGSEVYYVMNNYTGR